MFVPAIKVNDIDKYLGSQMIDSEGFRPNVGIILANDDGQVLWAKRIGHNAWQFPQGGIQFGETPEQALFRELREESAYCPNMSRLLRKPKDGCVIVCHIGTFGQTLTLYVSDRNKNGFY